MILNTKYHTYKSAPFLLLSNLRMLSRMLDHANYKPHNIKDTLLLIRYVCLLEIPTNKINHHSEIYKDLHSASLNMETISNPRCLVKISKYFIMISILIANWLPEWIPFLA